LKRVSEAKNDNLAKLVLVQVNFTKKIDESQENKREYNLFSRKLGNKRGYEWSWKVRIGCQPKNEKNQIWDKIAWNNDASCTSSVT